MQDNTQLRVAVIVGSTRTDRFCPQPANWIADKARKFDAMEVDVVDLADEDIPVIMSGDDPDAAPPEAVRALSARLTAADAFIVVTPVYNRGYPASLKNAIDWFYTEWSAKPIGYVSYGGMGGGVHAVEQLRTVFNEVHATSIRDAICFANFWETFDEEGQPSKSPGIDKAAEGFLDQLSWWGHALRDARAKHPYKA